MSKKPDPALVKYYNDKYKKFAQMTEGPFDRYIFL